MNTFAYFCVFNLLTEWSNIWLKFYSKNHEKRNW